MADVTDHCREKSLPIDQAIQVCGGEFVFQKLVRGSRDFIYDLERRAIVTFNTRWPNGYNQNAGGYGCRDPLPRTRERLSAAGKSPKNLARLTTMNRSLEAKARITAMNLSPDFQTHRLAAIRSPKNLAKLAAIKTPEWREKIRKSSSAPERVAQLIARNKSPESRERGKRNVEHLTALARSPKNRTRMVTLNKTPEHRAKQSAALRGRPLSAAALAAARSPENLARLVARNKSPDAKARTVAMNKSRAKKAA